MCIKNKNYMENWLFWGLNLGNLKQCMMIMLVLTSSSSAWTLCSLLHISSLINICNFYSFWATGMVLTSKWGRILQEIHCQCQIWLKWSAAGRRPANFHKRNYLLSVNTTDFEKTTIQAHSALLRGSDWLYHSSIFRSIQENPSSTRNGLIVYIQPHCRSKGQKGIKSKWIVLKINL